MDLGLVLQSCLVISGWYGTIPRLRGMLRCQFRHISTNIMTTEMHYFADAFQNQCCFCLFCLFQDDYPDFDLPVSKRPDTVAAVDMVAII